MLKKGLIGLAGVLVLAVAVAIAFLDSLSLAFMAPPVPFDQEIPPRAPDYDDPDAWSAQPEREDAADVVVDGLAAADPARTAVDVFYVHPTTYLGRRWNGPIDDAALNADTDELATLIQASAFNACCTVHAPRYRQASTTAFTHPSPDGRKAIELAYGDLADAFRHYLARSGDRPFILASHSQGTAHARRLLREEISGRALRERLVAAYLIGMPIPEGAIAHELPDIPICGSAEQTGCLVSWNARGPDYEPRLEPRETGGDPAFTGSGSAQRVCVNPLTWRTDGAAAGALENEGAVFLHADPSGVKPGFASARCRDGTLVVSEIGDVPRDFMSRLLDLALGGDNYHPIEYQLFYVNLRRNASERAAAHRAQREHAEWAR
jgi:hypothetical protein